MVTVSFGLLDVRHRKIVPSRIEVALLFVGSEPPLLMSYDLARRTFSGSFVVDRSLAPGSEIPIEVGVGAEGWFVGGAVTSMVVKK